MESNKEKYLKWTLLPFFGSWVFYLVLISVGSIGTAFARKLIDPKIELIPETLLKYALEFNQLYIWVPVVWLLGESGIRIIELFVMLRTGKVIENGVGGETSTGGLNIEQTENSFEEINQEFNDSRGESL